MADSFKENNTIDSIVTGEAKQTKKALYTWYIDYKKALDSFPHSWLIDVLRL